MVGTVVSIIEPRGFGFIERSGGEKDLFFHVYDLDESLEFNEQLRERRVEYDVADSPKG